AVPVGVRSMAPGRRKLIYASDGFLIDLLVERARERGHAALIGQVTPTSDRDRRVADVSVVLSTRTETLAKTTIDRLGEFHVEFEAPAQDLLLALDFERGETVITLAGLIKVQS